MTITHSPGPWTYSGTAGHESHGQSIVVPEKEGRTVCLVYDGAANASLIAAAPDLLAALIALVEAVENPEVDSLFELQAAHRAIDKAKG